MELNEMRRIAEAATPGPWIIDSLESGEHGVFVEESNPDYRKLGCASAIVASHLVGKNAEYLEAFDPDTMLALLSRLEQAEKNADTYQTLYEQRAESLEQAEQAVARVREVHRPVDVEPSETICHACSTLRGNGDSLRYFPYKEWPCDTIRALDGDPRADV